jgi:hypothetical protein
MIVASLRASQRWFLWLVPVAVTLFFGFLEVRAASDPQLPMVARVVFAVLVAVAWLSYLSIPRRIKIDGADMVLERPIGRDQLRIADVTKVDSRKWNRWFVTIRTKRGTIHLFRDMPNVSALVSEIARQNPTTKLLGPLPEKLRSSRLTSA